MRLRFLFLTASIALLLSGCGDEEEADTGREGQQAAIVIESPPPGSEVTSPVTVRGTASVFEGTVQLRILGKGGRELAATFATADAGAPGRGSFAKRIEFEVAAAQEGQIQAYAQNAASGAEGRPKRQFEVSVPVRLEP